MSPVPDARTELLNDRPQRDDGAFVLYWMVADRRPRWSYALQHAVERAEALDRPLVVLEPLRCGYRWASDRLHRFVLDGMAANRAAFADRPVLYHPYVEPADGHGKGLLAALSRHACLVVTDDRPGFFLRRMQAAAADLCEVRLERVDGNGLLPLTASDRAFPTAYSFRRFLQNTLPEHLGQPFPDPDPTDRGLPVLDGLPDDIARRWPAADPRMDLADLPIDHSVPPSPIRGGWEEGERTWRTFLTDTLERYAEDRNHPGRDAGSGLSPYLHFGHISVHQVFSELAEDRGWEPADLADEARGKRSGWWGMDGDAESFLDELITWRELGHHFCHHRDDYDRWSSLPGWARQTLLDHAGDPRDEVYDYATLRDARTGDELWNAAQRQLRVEGRIHSYLRMLWGKKVLQWTEHPEQAMRWLIELNNTYALDGRDPNSYSGIFWVLGRHDRAWGPERPIFGKVRYMTSKNTRRKLDLGDYLERWASL